MSDVNDIVFRLRGPAGISILLDGVLGDELERDPAVIAPLVRGSEWLQGRMRDLQRVISTEPLPALQTVSDHYLPLALLINQVVSHPEYESFFTEAQKLALENKVSYTRHIHPFLSDQGKYYYDHLPSRPELLEALDRFVKKHPEILPHRYTLRDFQAFTGLMGASEKPPETNPKYIGYQQTLDRLEILKSKDEARNQAKWEAGIKALEQLRRFERVADTISEQDPKNGRAVYDRYLKPVVENVSKVWKAFSNDLFNRYSDDDLLHLTWGERTTSDRNLPGARALYFSSAYVYLLETVPKIRLALAMMARRVVASPEILKGTEFDLNSFVSWVLEVMQKSHRPAFESSELLVEGRMGAYAVDKTPQSAPEGKKDLRIVVARALYNEGFRVKSQLKPTDWPLAALAWMAVSQTDAQDPEALEKANDFLEKVFFKKHKVLGRALAHAVMLDRSLLDGSGYAWNDITTQSDMMQGGSDLVVVEPEKPLVSLLNVLMRAGERSRYIVHVHGTWARFLLLPDPETAFKEYLDHHPEWIDTIWQHGLQHHALQYTAAGQQHEERSVLIRDALSDYFIYKMQAEYAQHPDKKVYDEIAKLLMNYRKVSKLLENIVGKSESAELASLRRYLNDVKYAWHELLDHVVMAGDSVKSIEVTEKERVHGNAFGGIIASFGNWHVMLPWQGMNAKEVFGKVRELVRKTPGYLRGTGITLENVNSIAKKLAIAEEKPAKQEPDFDPGDDEAPTHFTPVSQLAEVATSVVKVTPAVSNVGRTAVSGEASGDGTVDVWSIGEAMSPTGVLARAGLAGVLTLPGMSVVPGMGALGTFVN